MSTPYNAPSATEYGNAPGYQLKEVPRFVQFTSPVSTGHAQGDQIGIGLPLNLVALIVSYLDDIGDIARVCRASRLLYYMTLPQLYRKVSLHSYPEIRYVGGRPEGYGSGSPFTMALNGLVTKSHAALVHDFRIWGQWREIGVEDFAKGRVPDNSMMLNILLRAVVDKMLKLQSFSWELDCKPLKTLYQGLAARNTLTSLTIRFPNSRIPRPSVTIPPMPALRQFRMMDYDPLCHPDDLSMLMLHSRNLQDIRLHFSPRMRREAEPSLSLEQIFGRCFKADYAIPCKHFAMQNFYGANMLGIQNVFTPETCESMCFIDTFGGATGAAANIFVDDTWRNLPKEMKSLFRYARTNEMATQHKDMIRRGEGLERMYFVSARRSTPTDTPGSASAPSPVTPQPSPGTVDADITQLGKDYLYALTRQHGSTLKHLLLSDQWALTPDEIGDLIRFCPNLEQLGLALNTANHNTLRLLVPFLPKLRAIRILHNDWLTQHFNTISDEVRLEAMSKDLWKSGAENLEWIGIGDRVLKTGGNYSVVMEDGSMEMRREVLTSSREEVEGAGVEVWRLDCCDIFADPPFG